MGEFRFPPLKVPKVGFISSYGACDQGEVGGDGRARAAEPRSLDVSERTSIQIHARKSVSKQFLDIPPKLPLLPGSPVDLIPCVGLWKKVPYDLKNTFGDKGVLYVRQQIQFVPTGIVICCHGQLGFAGDTNIAYLTVWESLAKCLALHGFVVASIRHHLKGSGPAADQILRHISFLLGNDPSNPAKAYALQGKPLALIGHSEGGAGAIIAALQISNFALSNIVSFVNAIVALAPSKKEIEWIGEVFPMVPAIDSLLILQGTHDGDSPAGAGSLVPYSAAKPMSFKHFCWIHGANHTGMLDLGDVQDFSVKFTEDQSTRIATETQGLIVRNYATSFLMWRIVSENNYRSIFTADAHFQFAQDPTQRVQDDIKFGRLRIDARFDWGPFSDTPTVSMASPDKIKFSNMLQGGMKIDAKNPAKFLPLSSFTGDTDILIADSTPGFVVEWNRATYPKPSITVPCVASPGSAFVEFSAVLADPQMNPATGLTVATYLYRRNNLNQIIPGPVVFVNIPSPLLMKTFGDWTRSVLSTIRIPISSWGITPQMLMSIVQFELRFYESSANRGRVAVTNFRITKG